MPESDLARLAQEHLEPPTVFAIRYDGPFGAGTERFRGWLIGLSMITNYHDQTLPDGVGVIVALFLTEQGRVLVTYDRGTVPRSRDLGSAWSLGESVKWLEVCEDLSATMPVLTARGAESVAVYRAHLDIINLQADWARHARR